MAVLSSSPVSVSVWHWITAGIDEDAVQAQSDVLSNTERERCERFVFADDRRDFAAAHVLLRHALSMCAPVAPTAWQFATGQYGKPFIAGPDRAARNIAFNLSHTKGLVACAITQNARVGVDVERVRATAGLLDVARRFFAPAEARSLEEMWPTDRASRFAEFWTLKESYIKATGRGLAAPLDSFAFDLSDAPELRFGAEDDDPCSWHFILAAPTPETRLAVAVDVGTRAFSYRCIHGATAMTSADMLRVLAESPVRTAGPGGPFHGG